MIVGVQANLVAAEAICESELSDVGTLSAVRVLKLALALKEITPQQLLEFAEAGQWFDPIARQKRSEGTLSLQRAFSRSTRSATAADWAQIQKAAYDLARLAELQNDQTEVVREETRKIFSLKTITSLLDKRYKLIFDVIHVKYYAGRPIVMAKVAFGLGTQVWRTLIFDPFNEDENLRLHSVGRASQKWDNDYIEHELFEIGGALHAAVKTEGIIYDLGTQRYQNVPTYDERFPVSFDLVNSVRGDFAVFASRQTRSLEEFDLKRPDEKPSRIPVKENYGSVSKTRVGSKSYILFEAKDTLEIVDVDESKVIHQVDLKALSAPSGERLLFENSGRLQLIYRVVDGEKGEVHVLDLITNRSRVLQGSCQPTASGGQLEIVHLNGVPHGYCKSNDRLVVLNLQTGEIVERFSREGGVFSSAQYRVNWNGRELLMFTDHLGWIYVYDFQIQDFVGHIPFTGKFIPFVWGGEIYAIVSYEAGGFDLALLTITDGEPAP